MKLLSFNVTGDLVTLKINTKVGNVTMIINESELEDAWEQFIGDDGEYYDLNVFDVESSYAASLYKSDNYADGSIETFTFPKNGVLPKFDSNI